MSTIEAAITRLVQEAPAIDRAVVGDLLAALRADARPLALAIANVLELVGTKIDPGIALPALATACSTLCDPRATEREHEAARYEIDTLLPVPRIDVAVESLSRGSRRQT